MALGIVDFPRFQCNFQISCVNAKTTFLAFWYLFVNFRIRILAVQTANRGGFNRQKTAVEPPKFNRELPTAEPRHCSQPQRFHLCSDSNDNCSSSYPVMGSDPKRDFFQRIHTYVYIPTYQAGYTICIKKNVYETVFFSKKIKNFQFWPFLGQNFFFFKNFLDQKCLKNLF